MSNARHICAQCKRGFMHLQELCDHECAGEPSPLLNSVPCKGCSAPCTLRDAKYVFRGGPALGPFCDRCADIAVELE